MSNFDKKWFNSNLKVLQRRKQREFFKYGKTAKWNKLRKEFQRKKRTSIQNFYNNFTDNLIKSNPRKFFSMTKKIAATTPEQQICIPEIQGLSDIMSAEKIADYFSGISNQYEVVNLEMLPCYLPSLSPPQVSEYQVLSKLRKLKNTKSTNPIDLPAKLKREHDIFLANPLADKINACLREQIFPHHG